MSFNWLYTSLQSSRLPLYTSVVAEMEAEAAKLREMTAASEQNSAGGEQNGDATMNDEDKEAVDSRSVYVGNVSLSCTSAASVLKLTLFCCSLRCLLQVDYASTPEEIQAHFASCGTINRVTILFDKYTGPKGCAFSPLSLPPFYG